MAFSKKPEITLAFPCRQVQLTSRWKAHHISARQWGSLRRRPSIRPCQTVRSHKFHHDFTFSHFHIFTCSPISRHISLFTNFPPLFLLGFSSPFIFFSFVVPCFMFHFSFPSPSLGLDHGPCLTLTFLTVGRHPKRWVYDRYALDACLRRRRA